MKLLCIGLLIGVSHSLAAQVTLSGYLTDAEDGEPLLSAAVVEVPSGLGALANTYGFYSLTLPDSAQTVTLRFSYVGYRTEERTVRPGDNRRLDVRLAPSVDLQTIEVTSEQEERIEEQTQMSRTEIPVAQVKRIPAVLGEVDVLKTLQLLPGDRYGVSRYAYQDAQGNPFAEPVTVHNNVENGYGYFLLSNVLRVELGE